MDRAASGWTLPERFDGLTVVRPLGAGGMGHVFLAREDALDREVAVKLVKGERPTEHERARFLREARALARMQHPNVVTVYRIGEVEGRPYLVYELVRGRSLERETSPWPWPEVLDMSVQAARGLAAAHRVGVLHRDLKPGNIVVSPAAEVKLIDFGVAKLLDDGGRHSSAGGGPSSAFDTAAGAVIGTPLYMAPEVLAGSPAGEAADVYGLGLVLHELLTGTIATDRATALRNRAPDRWRSARDIEGLPPELASLLERTLERDPGARIPTGDALRDELEAIHAACRARHIVPDRSRSSPAVLAADAEQVRTAFADALRHPGFVPAVYARLWAMRPEWRSLFPSDMGALMQKLGDTLTLAMGALSDPKRLHPMLERLGARHAEIGVAPEDLEPFGEALLLTVEETLGAFSEGARSVWQRAYAEIADSMVVGMRRASSDAGGLLTETADTRSGAERRAPPRTRYAGPPDSVIAYQVLGDGPVDLVIVPEWVSHLEVGWQLPEYGAFLRALAKVARVTVFDKRGTGMSDRMPRDEPIEERILDIDLVLDAVGAGTAVLFGIGAGAQLAATYAAMKPDRVRGCVLYGTGARFLSCTDYPHGIPSGAFEDALAAVTRHWGEPLFLDLFFPERGRDPAVARWWADYLRLGASPGAALALLRQNGRCDLRPILPALGVPALVLHRSGDRVMPLGGARVVASQIPGAELRVLAGDEHLPWLGDAGAVIAETARFLESLVRSKRAATALVAPLVLHAGGAPIPEAAHRSILSAGGAPRPTDDPHAAGYVFGGPVRALEGAALALAAAPSARAALALHAEAHDLAAPHVSVFDEPIRLARTAPAGVIRLTSGAATMAAGSRFKFEPAPEHDAGAMQVAPGAP